MTALRRADVVLESRPNAAFPPSVREAEASLRQERFELVDLRDAPDRPGREVVFITRRAP
jgi:hypothetical protein